MLLVENQYDFSIIIPAKNEENYIGQCIYSILNTDYPQDRIEVIVVDNGSVDNTLTIANQFDVGVYSRPALKTISAVRNFGAQNSKGTVLCFLDADCTVSTQWLRNAAIYLHQPDIVCFGASPDIPATATWVERVWYLVRKGQGKVFERAWQESTNMFVRREIFEKVLGFNEELTTCEDVDLSYKLLREGKIICDYRIGVVHHRDPKTIVQFFFKELWRGKSNYTGFRQHGFRLDELPSLVLPLYYLIMTCLLLVGILCRQWYFAVVVLFLWQVPIACITFLKIQRQSTYRYTGQLFFLYNIYYLARGLSALKG